MARKGKSNRVISYVCKKCGREVGKDNLRSKVVIFKELGQGGRQLKSTTDSWLCIIPQEDGSPSCCDLDEHWQAEKWIGTPGMANTSMEKAE